MARLHTDRLPESLLLHILPLQDISDAWLSEDERARMATFGNEGRKKQFATGRMVLKEVVGEATHQTATNVELVVEESGALAVKNDSSLFVSLSHSTRHALAAVATCPIGVDIERIKVRRPDLWRYILHPDEYDSFHALELASDEKLILYWTLKEAVLKGLKTGFRLSPKKLKTTLNLPQNEATVEVVSGRDAATEDELPLLTHWQLCFGRYEDAYWAVAWVL